MIEPAAAVEESRRGVQRVPAAAAISATAHPGEPLLVTRIDQPHGDYYLVPWEDERGIVLVVQVNAWTGAAAAVVPFPTPQRRLVMSPDEARSAASARLATAVIAEPRLVWQPSRESASALMPLYQVITANGDNAFVAADGSVFRSLTPFGRGG